MVERFKFIQLIYICNTFPYIFLECVCVEVSKKTSIPSCTRICILRSNICVNCCPHCLHVVAFSCACVRLTWLSCAACDANAFPQYLHWNVFQYFKIRSIQPLPFKYVWYLCIKMVSCSFTYHKILYRYISRPKAPSKKVKTYYNEKTHTACSRYIVNT